MTDIDIFKHTARTTLPAPVYQQLLPHLDTLLTTYETNNAAKEGDLYEQACEASYRFSEIREEYEDATDINWQSFARERWPEIDKYFKFKAIDPLTKKVVHPPENAPTTAPWARSQPSNGAMPPWKKV